MIDRENYISVFKERKTPEGRVREPIGDFPVKSGTYDLPDGGTIILDISGLTTRLHGSRVIGVRIGNAPRFNEVSLNRLTGRGYQVLPNKNHLTGRGYQVLPAQTRLGVEVYNPRGVTTK